MSDSADIRPVLLFVTTRLGGGGAERHLVRLANSLESKYRVQIAVLRPGGNYEEFVSSTIPIHHLTKGLASRSTLVSSQLAVGTMQRLVARLRPCCIISFLEPVFHTVNQAIKRMRDQPPHLVAIQNNPQRTLSAFDSRLKRPFLSGIVNAIKAADGVIAISNGVAEATNQMFPGVAAKSTTIYNTAFEQLPDVSAWDRGNPPVARNGQYQLVACGRLIEQKGFSDLLQAFQQVRRSIDAGLWILGVGPLEKPLRRQAESLGIANSLNFLGFQADPLPYFYCADLFVLSSWWEGFGNVIVEAMSVGTPVVSTTCPYGPAEIIQHGESGMLVPPHRPDELAEQINSVLHDEQLRQKLGSSGRQRSMDFVAEKIADQYDLAISKTRKG